MTLASGVDFEALSATYEWPTTEHALQPHIRLNMAVTVSGDYVDEAGQSNGLSSTDDRRLLKIIRSGAQAILVGARTIRAEGWNLPATGVLVVLTESGNLPWETCPEPDRVRVISGIKSPQEIVQILHESGERNILVEGGRSVARQFAAAGLFDDVCLTVNLGNERRVTDDFYNSDTALEAALIGLLRVESGSYDLISKVGVASPPSVFTLWRRAISSPPPAAH